MQQILTNYTTHEELQQILNQIEVCPAGTAYEGFFVNGDGDPDTTVPEDEVMTEICIPTAQLNVIKTTTCNVEKFGQEFCNSIRESKISVFGNNPTPSFFFGTGPLGTNVSLGPGAYHVDEAGFTEGLESCQMKGFDGGRNLVSDSIFICTNFSDECQGDITLGIPQTCTIDNNVLGEANFLDIVTAHIGSNTVSILLGTGIGTFGTATTFPAAGDTPTSVAVGDFNGDDVLDIATANRFSHDVSILLGNGDGTFGTATTFPVAPAINPRSIVVGDFTSTTPAPTIQLQQQQRTNEIITTTNNNDDNNTIIKNISQQKEEQKQQIEEEQKIQKNNTLSPPSLPKNAISIPLPIS